MTKEQAIERLKSKLDNDKEYLEQCNPFSDLVNEVRLDNKSIETVLFMLKEKDKIIDLMAETINNHDIDEDICKQMGQKEDCNEFEDKEKCKKCIKQYFENKAKERR